MADITVVMRTRNSEKTVAQALSALFSQDYRSFELVVIDSGSKDRTLEIVGAYPARIVEIPPENYFPGDVLNMAVSQAKSDIVVFQNSDTIPVEPGVLGRLVDSLRNPDVAAAYVRQVPRPDAETWVRSDYQKSFPSTGEAPSWIRISFPMAAIRKSVWEKHNFYSDAWASEDTEWGNWALREGFEINYVSDVSVIHSHNYTLKQIYGRRYVEGEADAFIFGGKESVFDMIRMYTSSVVHDIPPHLKSFDIKGLLLSPIRRFVYHWAHFNGHRHGRRRIESGSRERDKGRDAVLSRYD